MRGVYVKTHVCLDLIVPAWSKTRSALGSGADGQVAIHTWVTSPEKPLETIVIFHISVKTLAEISGIESSARWTLRGTRVGSGSPPDARFPQPPPRWQHTRGREPAPWNPSACVRLSTSDSLQVYILPLKACGGAGTFQED